MHLNHCEIILALYALVCGKNCLPWKLVSLIAQLVKNLPAMQETWFDSWVRKILWRRDRLPTPVFLRFPYDSDGKESTCNARDPSSIPGSGRSSGEGTGYPLQYSWASLVVQLVENPPAMQGTYRRPEFNPWVGKIPWRRERLPTPVVSPGEFHGLQSRGLQRVRYDWATFTFTFSLFNLHAEYIMWNGGQEESQVGIKIARRNINNLVSQVIHTSKLIILVILNMYSSL